MLFLRSFGYPSDLINGVIISQVIFFVKQLLVGLDHLSETLLSHARKLAEEQNLPVEFVHSDTMERIFMLYPHHSIEGEKTIVEPLEEADLPTVKALMDDTEMLAILRTTKKELATWVKWYRTYWADDLVFRIRPRDEDTLLGWMKINGALRPNGTAWLSYMAIARPFWNKGYGADALRTLMHEFHESYGVAHWFLETDKDNLRSQRCYQKCGFHPISESVVDCNVTGRKVVRVKMEAHVTIS